MIDYNDFMVVIVSYFSYGWTQQCLESLWRHIPECRVLAVDNNPSVNDIGFRKKTFQNLQSHWPYNSKTKIKLNWNKSCDLEKDWLNSQKNIKKVIQTPYRFRHGDCLDLAVDYCVVNNVKRIVLIEPDCVILGNRWLYNLFNALDEGFWMSSGKMKSFNGVTTSEVLHPCPSAWVIEHAKKTSFKTTREMPNLNDDFFRKCNISPKKLFFWDTALKASYEFAKLGRAKFVKTNDLIHYWGKSSRSDFRISLI